MKSRRFLFPFFFSLREREKRQGRPTCIESSRVGVNMSPIGPFADLSARFFPLRLKLTWFNMGMRYPRVFPEPVLASARTSRPFKATGIACACIPSRRPIDRSVNKPTKHTHNRTIADDSLPAPASACRFCGCALSRGDVLEACAAAKTRESGPPHQSLLL